MIDFKICKRCKETKSIDRFYFVTKYNRHENTCKDCYNEKQRAEYHKNPAGQKAAVKTWISKNRDKHRVYTKNYAEAHAEQTKAAQRKYAKKKYEERKAVRNEFFPHKPIQPFNSLSKANREKLYIEYNVPKDRWV
jgi:hypothetical protein